MQQAWRRGPRVAALGRECQNTELVQYGKEGKRYVIERFSEFAPSGQAGALSARANLKLASFNVQNLGRGDNTAPAVFASKMEFITDVLQRIGADIVVIDEVREADSFDELADRLQAYPYRLLSDPPEDRRKIQIGILSGLPVREQGQWHDFPAVLPDEPGVLTRLKFRRPVPWVVVELPNGETLLVAAVHLKSRRAETEAVPEDEPIRRRLVLGRSLSGVTRMLEAAGLRCRLDEAVAHKAGDHTAVMGDFNAPPHSSTLSLVMGIDDEEGSELAESEERRLFPVAWKVPAERAFSYAGRGRRQLLDQILVSQKLSLCQVSAGIESQLVEAQARVHADFVAGYPRSDHAPVWAAFSLPGEHGSQEV